MEPSTDWRIECKELLDLLYGCGDSSPFREPVDLIDNPDYNTIIDTPMDLTTIKEDLFGGNYESPLDFAKDVRMIFQNSKNYNTNKRSKVSHFVQVFNKKKSKFKKFKKLNIKKRL